MTGQGDDLEARLHALVRRELLTLDSDPRSPERGQYGFVQALVRDVAYGTLTKRDRKVVHLAAGEHFESLQDDEIIDATAAHYLDAYRSAPEDPDAEEIRARCRRPAASARPSEPPPSVRTSRRSASWSWRWRSRRTPSTSRSCCARPAMRPAVQGAMTLPRATCAGR